MPGLRGLVNFFGYEEGAVYLKRYTTASYTKMIARFMSHVPDDFPKSGSGASMPGYRVTLPNEDRFYPIRFFGDLDAWRKRLRESAEMHGSELAHFDEGKFVLWDGKRVDFGGLRVELLKARRHPKSW